MQLTKIIMLKFIIYRILVQIAELLLVLVNLIKLHAITLSLKIHMHKVEMIFKSTECTTRLKEM